MSGRRTNEDSDLDYDRDDMHGTDDIDLREILMGGKRDKQLSKSQQQNGALGGAKSPPSQQSQRSNTNRMSQNSLKSQSDQQNRDVLLLRCRDAIEELHSEIEEERNQKAKLQKQVQELQQFVSHFKAQEKE